MLDIKDCLLLMCEQLFYHCLLLLAVFTRVRKSFHKQFPDKNSALWQPLCGLSSGLWSPARENWNEIVLKCNLHFRSAQPPRAARRETTLLCPHQKLSNRWDTTRQRVLGSYHTLSMLLDCLKWGLKSTSSKLSEQAECKDDSWKIRTILNWTYNL